jgi:hypothetical protein
MKYPISTFNDNTTVITSETFQLVLMKDGSFSLLDRISGTDYTPDPWGEGPGTLSISHNNEGKKTTQTLPLSGASEINSEIIAQSIHLSYSWSQGILLKIRLSLEEDAFTIVLESLNLPDKTELVNLVYPSRFASLITGENGYLVVPAHSGMIIPSHYYTRIGGEFWRMDDAYQQANPDGITNPFFSWMFSFNFFAVQKEDSGLTFICDDAFDASLRVFTNTRGQRYSMNNGKWSMKDQISAFSTVWDASIGQLGYSRKLTIRRHGKGGYVESAALYRQWLDDNNWSRTFADKIKQNPEREIMIGSSHIDIYGGYPHYAPKAPDVVDFTFDQVTSIINSISQDLKVDRASISVWGIYENYPPTHWPINKGRGGLKAWKKTVDTAKEAGYLISGYHSYFPQLEHDPNFDSELVFQRNPDHKDPAMRAAATSRWTRTCSSFSLELAKETLSKAQKEIGENGHFIDIMGVASAMECYDTQNHRHSKPLTRKEDKELRNATFAYVHDDLNLVTWEEHGTATDLKTMDSFQGIYDISLRFEETGVQIPLASLVAHDMVMLTQHPENNQRHARGQFYSRTLHNILQGNRPVHCIQVWEYEGRKNDIARFHETVAVIHRQVGLSRMIDHQFLPGPGIYDTGTFLIQKTKFDDGTEIYANFGVDPYHAGDVKLEPYGFEARLSNGKVIKGCVDYELQVL